MGLSLFALVLSFPGSKEFTLFCVQSLTWLNFGCRISSATLLNDLTLDWQMHFDSETHSSVKLSDLFSIMSLLIKTREKVSFVRKFVFSMQATWEGAVSLKFHLPQEQNTFNLWKTWTYDRVFVLGDKTGTRDLFFKTGLYRENCEFFIKTRPSFIINSFFGKSLWSRFSSWTRQTGKKESKQIGWKHF